jgi:hypothetical protein
MGGKIRARIGCQTIQWGNETSLSKYRRGLDEALIYEMYDEWDHSLVD